MNEHANFDVGALVRARGREWVVLPESAHEADMLILRPLGGTDDEVTGIYLPLEKVEHAKFQLPDPTADMGSQLTCRLLRDAVRLGFRSGAGPFRSLARIAVEPRPYQLVPLLMALKLDPVRLLIADDVGIGKTVEALLVARELIDRGEVRGMTVLCPPHLAEQWQKALTEQFHIDAVLVLSGTAAPLERSCRQDQSLFERYPFTVVSTDYIKTERRREEFLRTCPELVIVDEAHTCADVNQRGASQRRHRLLQDLISPRRTGGDTRHLVLVTATPHSGNEQAFRSLLGLLDPELLQLPEDLSGDGNRKHRERLAQHFVQRRRADLKRALGSETVFPDRREREEHYALSRDYRDFIDKVLAYCRETVQDDTVGRRQQRVRWWSALALLRAISSSPAAAVATLTNRSRAAAGDDEASVDAEGRRQIFDQEGDESEITDVVVGADPVEDDDRLKRRLKGLAEQAATLKGAKDNKLKEATGWVKTLLDDGYSPILFCRFIDTAEYLGEHLRKKFKNKAEVEIITGRLPAEERERKVNALGEHEKRVLVCTDCLSEGINLQHIFDAVMHYDLSWNPTRHEQRDGRVDRYGQPRTPDLGPVRVLTLYGKDNPVDGIVLEVLLRKHAKIRKTLGISVPVPSNTAAVEDAILEGLLLRTTSTATQLNLGFIESMPKARELDAEWKAAEEREKLSRSLFAQNLLLKAVNEEVRGELEEVRRALGGEEDVRWFTQQTLQAMNVPWNDGPPLTARFDQLDSQNKQSVLDAVDGRTTLSAVFSGQPKKGSELLTRTHPVVEGLAKHVMETALDVTLKGVGKRCGVVRTQSVQARTTLLLLRMRFHIVNLGRDGKESPLLAEDLVLVGFEGRPGNAQWIEPERAEALLQAQADANIGEGPKQDAVSRILDRFDALQPEVDRIADERGAALFEAHRRVRKATKAGVRALKVEVHKPVDVLGVYVFLPAGGAQ